MNWSFLRVPGLAREEPRGTVPGEVPSESRRKRERSHQQLPDGSSLADTGFLNNLYLRCTLRSPPHALPRPPASILCRPRYVAVGR